MFAQGVQRGIDAPAFGQHGPEGAAGLLGLGDLRREQMGALADQQRESAVRPGLVDLADAEKAHETARVFLEEQAMLSRDGAAGDDAQPVHDERGAPPFRLRLAHHGAFDDLGATAHMVGGVEILAHHPADALRERTGET